MREWTAEPRWDEVARETAAALRARRGDDGLWRQDDDYRGLGTLHGVAGNTLVLLRLGADGALAAGTAAVLARHAFREEGLANWPDSPRPQLARPRDGRICVQWCTGAPGVVAGAWEYLDEDLLLAGAELTWQAGAHGDEKGHGICHGTSGNGFALLKAFARSPSTRSARPSVSAPPTDVAVTHFGPATSARHSSPPRASTSMRATRSSTSSNAC